MKNNNDRNVTLWGDPDEMLKSQYGTITYREWCLREARRLVAAGRAVKVANNQQLQVAIAKVD